MYSPRTFQYRSSSDRGRLSSVPLQLVFSDIRTPPLFCDVEWVNVSVWVFIFCATLFYSISEKYFNLVFFNGNKFSKNGDEAFFKVKSFMVKWWWFTCHNCCNRIVLWAISMVWRKIYLAWYTLAIDTLWKI